MRTMRRILAEARRIWDALGEAGVGMHGAAVAYYAVFSIAPLLIVAIGIVGVLVDSVAATEAIVRQFEGAFGDGGGEIVRSLVSTGVSDSSNALFALVGGVLVLLSASAVFSALQEGLDAIFVGLHERPSRDVWQTVLSKLLSVGMVLSIGFILLASLLMSAIIASVSEGFQGLVPGVLVLARIADFIASLLLVTLLLGSMLKFLPTKRLPWRPAILGGLIGSGMFMVGKYALGSYLGASATLSAYGAASSVVLLLVWAFYLSQAFFLSAILTHLYLVPRSAKR